MKVYAIACILLVFVIVPVFADHAQVNVSLIADTEISCTNSFTCVDPAETSLDVGGEIIWSNDGTQMLTIVIGTDSISLDPGQTYSRIFNEVGEFDFHSEQHPWMTGTIFVVSEEYDEEHMHDDAGHQHGEHKHGTIPVESLGVDVTGNVDQNGVDVHITTIGLVWAPENVNQEHVSGEGHAHIYLDGVKINRVYGPYYHISGVEPGSHHIRVTLSSNDHSDLQIGDNIVEAAMVVVVPEHDHDAHDHEQTSTVGTEHMGVEAIMHSDKKSEFNLQIITTDFTVSGQNVGGDHMQGEGYAVVTIDGEYHTRMYEQWLKLPALDPGEHTITVYLYTNNHSQYSWDDQPISSSIIVNVNE